MMSSRDTLDNIEEFIYQLRRIAMRLRALGFVMLLTTLLNLSILFSIAARFFPQYLGVQFAAILFVSAVLLAVLFEQLRRRGEVIYEELTDELHRAHRDPEYERPRLSFRIALKTFASSLEVPLIPGRFGISIYLLINIICLIVSFAWRSSY